MPTTIQVADDTKRMLQRLQQESGKTYNEIINDLINHKKQSSRSLFGKHKGRL